jgi:PPP family 3-phenylpropionic acid transporter
MPIAEALASASMRGHPDAATRYGRLRVWGSTAFVVVVLTAGPLFDRFGIGLALGLGLAILAVLVAASWQVTEARHGEHPPDSVSVSQRLREPCVRWFLLSAGLMIFAHGALYAYLSIYLAQLGYSKTSIGVFWVLSVLLEIVFFVTQGRWIRRFGLYPLLVASFVAASVRFMLIAEFAAIWWILAFAQILHAMTFAVHHSASVLTVQRWFSGRAAARGQAIYISAAWGLGGTLGGLMAAFLWSFAGPRWAFGAGSIAAVLGLLAIRRARQNDPAFPSPERVGFKLERSPE